MEAGSVRLDRAGHDGTAGRWTDRDADVLCHALPLMDPADRVATLQRFAQDIDAGRVKLATRDAPL